MSTHLTIKTAFSPGLFSLVLVAGDMIYFAVKSENMKRGLWSRLPQSKNRMPEKKGFQPFLSL